MGKVSLGVLLLAELLDARLVQLLVQSFVGVFTDFEDGGPGEHCGRMLLRSPEVARHGEVVVSCEGGEGGEAEPGGFGWGAGGAFFDEQGIDGSALREVEELGEEADARGAAEEDVAVAAESHELENHRLHPLEPMLLGDEAEQVLPRFFARVRSEGLERRIPTGWRAGALVEQFAQSRLCARFGRWENEADDGGGFVALSDIH
jgi:hypothetical protein